MTYWCDVCHREFQFWRQDTFTSHWGDKGKCPGKVVPWDPDLPACEGWQTEPPPPPPDNSNHPGQQPEQWWFWGVHRDRAEAGFELSVVKNVLLGSGAGAWQMIFYHYDYAKPQNLKGYWKRLPDPDTLPPVPPLPKPET